MKRSTPLRRGKPLARTRQLARASTLRRSPMRRKRRRLPPAHLRDDAYRAWIASLPCCAPGCTARPPSHPHHHSLTGTRGKAQKPHDHYCIPLCADHHVPGLHSLAGPFKGWTRARLKQWQDERVAECRELYARRAA